MTTYAEWSFITTDTKLSMNIHSAVAGVLITTPMRV